MITVTINCSNNVLSSSYIVVNYGQIMEVYNKKRQNGRHFADEIFKCIFLKYIYVFIEVISDLSRVQSTYNMDKSK